MKSLTQTHKKLGKEEQEQEEGRSANAVTARQSTATRFTPTINTSARTAAGTKIPVKADRAGVPS